MPILSRTPPGTVTALWGQAFIKAADGKLRPLKLGDAIKPGDVLLTEQNGIVQITDPKGTVRVAQPDELDRVIAAIESGEEAPAAGFSGGDGSLQPGLRVARIVESTVAGDPPQLLEGGGRSPAPTLVDANGAALAAAPPAPPAPAPAPGTPPAAEAPPTVQVDVPALSADPTPRVSGSTNQPAGSTVQLTVTDANGGVHTLPVTVGAGGGFEVELPFPLPSGGYQVEASVTTPGGQSASANDGGLINLGPSAAADAATLGEDAGAQGNVITDLPGRDTDPESDTLTVLGVASGVHASASGGVGAALVGDWGTLLLRADGSYSYQPLPAAQSLAAGASATDRFSYTISDGHGGTATATLTLTIRGSDDGAQVSAGSGSVVERLQPSVSGDLAASDADNPALAFVPALQAGQWGSLLVGADGSWTYTLDARADALAQGQAAADSFTVALSDGSSTTVAIAITGTDSRALISGAGNGATVEDLVLASSGRLVAEDADAGQAAFVAQSGVAGAHGWFSIAADGAWTYTLDNADPAVQALRFGASLPAEQFTVQTLGGASSVVTVGIAGHNDAPLALDEDLGAVEDGAVISGRVSASDVDAGTVLSYALAGPAPAGLTFNADGSYSFDPAQPAYQALPAGQTLLLSVPYTATDERGATSTAQLLIRIAGSDDAAEITVGSGSVVEDLQPSTGGQLAASDADNPALAFVPATLAGDYGVLVVGADGQWRYTLDSRADALAQGQAAGEVFTVSLNDGSSTTVSIAITGTADTAVITGSASGTVTEDGVLLAAGQLHAFDSDGPAGFVAAAASGSYGDFAIAADGSWTYTLRNAEAPVQALTSAQHPVESFVVHATDGTPAVVSITVNGANEVPVAMAVPAGGTEDALAIPVQLAGSDSDGSVAGFTLLSLPAHGTLLSNGQPLAVGDTVAASGGSATLAFVPDADWHGSTAFDFSATDDEGAVSAPQTLPISVTPANDAALAAPDQASTPINTPLSAIDVLANDSDADGDALSVVGASVDPALGSVSVNPDGTLSFTPATDVTGPVSVSYTLSDGQATSVGTLTVNVGANTPPQGSDARFTLPEDGSRSFAAADFGFHDADAGQTFAGVRIDSLPLAGTLTLAGAPVSAGQLIAVADLAGLAYAPAPDQHGADYAAFTFSVQDSAGAFDAQPNTIRFDVTPAPDAAVIAGHGQGATVEDLQLVAAGQLTVSDPDAGEATFQAQTGVAGAHGVFSIATSGAWTYTLDNTDPAVQALAAGQTLPAETFVVRSADGTTASVVVTITGTNDPAQPTLGSGTVTEDANVDAAGRLVTGGQLGVSDVDAGEAAFVPSSAAGAYGSFTLAADGRWSYSALNANPAIQGLAAGQVLVESFGVATVDGTPSVVTVTIVGVDDAALVSAGSGSVTEDGVLTTGGSLSVVDPDAGQSSFAAQAVQGSYGSFTLAADGQWTYTLDNALPQVQALVAGQTLSESFAVATADGTPSSVNVSIHGVDDAPTVAGATVSLSEEGLARGNADALGTPDTTDAVTVTGQLAIADVDSGSLSVTLSAPATPLSSGGVALSWSTPDGGSTLVGSAGGKTVLTASIDAQGRYQVSLWAPIDHATAGVEDLKSFGIGVLVSDGSATSAGTITVNVEDDSARFAGTPQAAVIANAAGTVLAGDLQLAIGADRGAAAKVQFSGVSVDANGFILASHVDAAGQTVTQQLTHGGLRLHYEAGPTPGSLVARDELGADVFTVSADQLTGQYRIALLAELDAGVVSSTSFGALKAGNTPLTYVLTDTQGHFVIDIVGTAGGAPSTVNTNKGYIGVGNNFVDAPDKLSMDFNTDMRSVSLKLDGLGSGEQLRVTAFDAHGAQVGAVFTTTGSGPGTAELSVNLTTAQFGGEFSRLEFSAGAGTSYRVGLTQISGESSTLKQGITLGASAVDADQDATAVQPISVLFDGPGTLTAGSAAGSALAGSGSNETLLGGAGADTISGGGGHDTITGGSGADVFAWRFADAGAAGSPAVDTLTDFDVAPRAAGGDVLDLRDLLHGEATDMLDRFLDFDTTSNPGSTLIHVSSAGSFPAGATWSSGQAGGETQTIVLQGVDLRAALNLPGASDQQLIQELVTRGKLITDSGS